MLEIFNFQNGALTLKIIADSKQFSENPNIQTKTKRTIHSYKIFISMLTKYKLVRTK